MEIETIIEIGKATFVFATSLVTFATIIARCTKTTKDDTYVEKARLVLENIGNLFLKDKE